MNKILLVDGNSLAYRAYYGFVKKTILTNSEGIPVNAVLTFNKMLLKVINQYQPKYVFVAFDAAKKTKRHELFKDYKGKRQKTPPELIQQFPIIKEMLDHMNIKHFEKNGFEADDIIASMIKKFPQENFLILSSDKDMYQLVSKNVEIIGVESGKTSQKTINNDNFFDILNFYPQQVIDYKGIVGDASDNLPGIHGIGKKTAINWLLKYKNLENVYKNIKDFTPRIQEILHKNHEMAFLCKKMATLIFDINIDIPLTELEYKEKASLKLLNFYKKYQLNSLLNKYENEVIKSKNIKFDKIFF